MSAYEIGHAEPSGVYAFGSKSIGNRRGLRPFHSADVPPAIYGEWLVPGARSG